MNDIEGESAGQLPASVILIATETATHPFLAGIGVATHQGAHHNERASAAGRAAAHAGSWPHQAAAISPPSTSDDDWRHEIPPSSRVRGTADGASHRRKEA